MDKHVRHQVPLQEKFKNEYDHAADDGYGEKTESAPCCDDTKDKCDSSGNGAVCCFHDGGKSHDRQRYIGNVIEKALNKAVFYLTAYQRKRDHPY